MHIQISLQYDIEIPHSTVVKFSFLQNQKI